MKQIDSETYAIEVENSIENYLYGPTYNCLKNLGKKFKFMIPDKDEYADIYAEYASDIRDIVISLFEACGMDIQPDWSDF